MRSLIVTKYGFVLHDARLSVAPQWSLTSVNHFYYNNWFISIIKANVTKLSSNLEINFFEINNQLRKIFYNLCFKHHEMVIKNVIYIKILLKLNYS
jgi:hypothetical protein